MDRHGYRSRSRGLCEEGTYIREIRNARKKNHQLVFGSGDSWVVDSDLDTLLFIPENAAFTPKRPDIVMIREELKV